MSALPKLTQVKLPTCLNEPVENPDDALLTDDEVYQLKGGNNFFAIKAVGGIVAAATYIIAFKRVHEVRNFAITGKSLLL